MSSVLITSKKKRVEAASSAAVAASSATVAVHQLTCERHDAQKLMNQISWAVKKKLGKGTLNSWLCGWWKLNIPTRRKKGRPSWPLSLACPKLLWTQQQTNAEQSGNMCSGQAET